MNIETAIDTLIRDFPEISENGEAQLVGDRQILIIKEATYFSTGYRPSTSDPSPKGQIYLALTGDPSPSSQVQKGYVRFVPKSEIKVPTYSDQKKEINLWVDENYLPMVLAQMEHSQRYLWIGFFNNGHTYADIHSAS